MSNILARQGVFMGKKKGKKKKDKQEGAHSSEDNAQQATSGDGLGGEVAEPEKLVGDGTPSIDYPRYRVEPGKPVRLADVDPNESEHYHDDEEVAEELERLRLKLEEQQSRLYAESKQSLLIVLQAMDTAGKDGTIKHVFGGINPQGC